MFVTCGLNHKTAPLPLREAFTLYPSLQEEWLDHLLDQNMVREVAILSTCNRTEIYCDTDRPQELIPWIVKKNHLSLAHVAPYFYQYQDEHSLRHAIRVASGLDSMMLGEPQIFGQMKQAYQQACQHGSIKKNLHPLFQYIFRASKRIRHRSGINRHPISVAYTAVQCIERTFPEQKSLNILLIGSGETAALVGKYLQEHDHHRITIASRTHEHAQELAQTLHGQSVSILDLSTYLPHADVVITATHCPLPFITLSMMGEALEHRQTKPMLLLDLAMPRNIEANVQALQGVTLYNIDDLNQTIQTGLHERRLAAVQAEQLINDEIEQYHRLHRKKQAHTVICDYRQHMRHLGQRELLRAKQRLAQGQSQDDVMQQLCDRLINKLTHRPTIKLKQAALDERNDLLDLAHYFLSET